MDTATLDDLLAKLDELTAAIQALEGIDRIEKEARLLDWRRGIELREQNADAQERIARAIEAGVARLLGVVPPTTSEETGE